MEKSSHKVFAVYDSKVEAYMNPFCMRSKGEAIRAFTSTVNSGESAISKYPEDFTLFEIGEYDEMTGVLTPHETRINLGVAIEFVRGRENDQIATISEEIKKRAT